VLNHTFTAVSTIAKERKLAVKPHPTIWVDQIKGLAILGIFFNHVIESILDTPLIGFPSSDWGSLESRIAQLQPLPLGHWTIPVNLLRYLGWMGNHGVALFLITSGFGLTWSLLQRQSRNASVNWLDFLKKRFTRIYPMWWVLHLGLMGTWLLTGWGLAATNWRTWVSLSGWRVLPSTPFYFAPAWWFIPLILQLYLLYPLLWKLMQRLGAKCFLISCCFLGLMVRILGFSLVPKMAVMWSMGVFGICRLPEFALGMALAVSFYQAPIATDRFLKKIVPLSILVFILSTAWGLTWTGAVFFQLLTGGSLSVILYAVILRIEDFSVSLGQGLTWLGKHSYAIFLIHTPVLFLLLPIAGWSENYWSHTGLVGLTLIVSIFAGLLLEKLTDWIYSLKYLTRLK
jgi:peptidoglycan/LPS O-acetylase OafA/YrhL